MSSGSGGDCSTEADRYASAPFVELARRVLDALPGAAMVVDRTGKVCAANPVAARLLGSTGNDLAGWCLFDLMSVVSDGSASQHRPDLRTIFAAVVTGQTVVEEVDLRRPDGGLVRIDAQIAPLLDDRGDVIGVVCAAADLSAAKLSYANAAAEKERLARERLEFLVSLNDASLGTSDHKQFMSLVTARAVPRLGDWCAIHFVGEPGSDPVVRAAHSDPAKIAWVEELQERYPFDPDAPTGVAAVLRTGRPELVHVDAAMIEQAITDSRRIGGDELRLILDLLQLTSVITVPLVTRRGVVGAMQFVSAESGRRYDDDDLSLAQAAAGRVGAALDNLWLSEQYRGVAQLLQKELLPPSLPVVPGVDIAVRYWAAGIVNEAGGDFYDVFEIAPNRWCVVVGDVCGTGPKAAAITAKARHTVRAAAMHGQGHAEVMEWVNDAVLAGKRGRFCTLVYATIERHDDGAWSFTSVAGGHPLPVLVDVRGQARLIGRHGTLIGVLPELDLTTSTTVFSPGDTIVMYTDGLTDVRPPYGLTEVEMRDAVARSVRGTVSAEEAADAIRSYADELLAIDQRSDDMALVILRLGDDEDPLQLRRSEEFRERFLRAAGEASDASASSEETADDSEQNPLAVLSTPALDEVDHEVKAGGAKS